MRRSGLKRHRAAQIVRLFGAVIGGGLCFSLPAQETRPPAVTVEPPSGRAATRTVLREAFPYDPSIRQKAIEQEKPPEEGVVKLAPVVVTAAKNDPNFERYIEQARANAADRRRRSDEESKPSIANGAKVSGRSADAGVMPYRDLIPFGPPLPRWDILNIRF